MIYDSKVGTVADLVASGIKRAEIWRKQRDHGPEWIPWFRGEPESKSRTALRPKLFRPKMPMSERLHCEQELRAEFRRQAAQLPLYKPADSWEWYFLMQHYGVPTRLLDWTDGILIGLHFAISSRGRKNDSLGETDAAVYLLDPWLLNIGAFAKYTTEIEGVALSEWRETKPYLPPEMKSETLARRSRLRSIRPTLPRGLPRSAATSRSSAGT